jgi:hypothetical protein
VQALDFVLTTVFFFGALVVACFVYALLYRLRRAAVVCWLGTPLVSAAVYSLFGLAHNCIRANYFQDPRWPLSEDEAHKYVMDGLYVGLYLGVFAGLFVTVKAIFEWFDGPSHGPDRS